MSERDVTEEEETQSGSISLQSLDALDPRKPRHTAQSYSETLKQSDPPDRILKDHFNRMLPRVASVLNEHIEDLKPTLRSHQKSDILPYNRLEIDEINKAKNVKEIFNKIQIEDCWFNTDVLVRLIHFVPDRKAKKKALHLLDAYHKKLEHFTKYIDEHVEEPHLPETTQDIGMVLV